jgi:hypothetical protein
MSKNDSQKCTFLSANSRFAVQNNGTYLLRITRETCIAKYQVAKDVFRFAGQTIHTLEAFLRWVQPNLFSSICHCFFLRCYSVIVFDSFSFLDLSFALMSLTIGLLLSGFSVDASEDNNNNSTLSQRKGKRKTFIH